MIDVSVDDVLPAPTFRLQQQVFPISLLLPPICVQRVLVADVTDTAGKYILWNIHAKGDGDNCVRMASVKFRELPVGFSEDSFVNRPLACGRKYEVDLSGPGFGGQAYFSFHAACQ
jgi:hypothetical protein